MTTDGKIQIGTGSDYLESVKVDTGAGVGLHREGVCVSDPEIADARQKVVNARPVGLYGGVVWVADSDPTASYKIADIDSGTPEYYGHLSAEGAWYIMRNDAGAYRYVAGASGYAAAWTARAAQSYDYFSEVF